MVEQEQAAQEDVVFESLPVNIEAGKMEEMSEFDKRLKRAARFGLDPESVAGPQSKIVKPLSEMPEDFGQVRDRMELIQGSERVEKI